MAEINVIVGDETPQTLGDDEIFEMYSENETDLAKIEAMVQLHDFVPKLAVKYEKPTIPELVLKKLVTMAGPLVIPIVRTGPVKKPPVAPIKRGGNEPTTFKIKFDKHVLTSTENGAPRILPRGEETTVAGLFINMVCEPAKLPKTAKVWREYTSGESEYNLIMRRVYKKCGFVHHGGCLYIKGEKVDKTYTLMFSGAGTNIALNEIFDYVVGEKLYGNNSVFDTMVDLAVRTGKGEMWEILKPTKDVNIPLVPEPPHTTSVMEVEKIYPGKFSVVTPGAVLSDCMRGGIVPVYEEAALGGDVQKMAAKYAETRARAQFLAKIRADIDERRATMGIYLSIVRKKFGESRTAAVMKKLSEKPAASLDVKRLMEILTPAEKKPVEIEFKRRQKYIENAGKNTCEHIQLHWKIFSEKNATRARDSFTALSKFFKSATGDKMIECNKCGYDVMCPHMKEILSAEYSGADQRVIKAIVSKYVDHTGARSQFFCKICGEVLSALEQEDDYKGIDDTVGVDEELSMFLWTEIAQLTRFLKFTVLVDTTKLISAARDACYPFIYDIERQLLKSRTSNAEELKSKKRLYATIYGLAYFIHLLGKNVTFRDFSATGGNSTVEAVKHVVRLIGTVRNVVIKNIPGMTADIIKNKVIEAYKSLNAASNIIVSDVSEDILDTLLVDPIYYYFEHMHAAATKPAKTILANVDDVLGAPVAKLEKSADIFGSAPLPNFSKWNVAAFTKLEKFSGKLFEGKKLICDMAAAGRSATIFTHFRERVQSKLQLEPLFAEVPGDIGGVFDVAFKQPHQVDFDKSSAMNAAEENYLAYLRAAFSHTYASAEVISTRVWSDKNVTKIGRIYDLTGNPHVWDYVVGDKIMSVRDFAAARSRGEDPGEYVDKKCRICGVLWSESESLDEDEIRAALRDKYTTSNFFKYFETRCPAGSVHERDDGGKCKKCGHHVAFLAAISASAMEYRKKYNAIYERERGVVSAKFTPTVYTQPREYKELDADFSSWAPNFDVILDLAEKVEVNHRLILALGSVEKQEYAEVSNGSYIPAEVDERNSTRAGVIDGHIRRLTIEFNRLRYVGNIPKPPQELLDLLDSAGVSKAAAAELGKRLPEIVNGYEDRFAYIKMYKRPREIIGFLLQTWCEMCLKIWNDPATETAKLRREFVKKYVTSTIRNEELLSKPGQFNWSLLYNDKKESARADSNVTGEEVEQTPAEAADDDDGGGFDIDIDPDADPEDTDNGVRVGEDYGID